jgi:hypothetical protein
MLMLMVKCISQGEHPATPSALSHCFWRPRVCFSQWNKDLIADTVNNNMNANRHAMGLFVAS